MGAEPATITRDLERLTAPPRARPSLPRPGILTLLVFACARPLSKATLAPSPSLPSDLAPALPPLIAQAVGARQMGPACGGAFSTDQGGELAFVVQGDGEVLLYAATLAPTPDVVQVYAATAGAPIELQCLSPAAILERNAVLAASEGVSGEIEPWTHDVICLSDAAGTTFSCFGLDGEVWRGVGGWTT